ncbi:MAG: hypothetical protein IH602_20355 [Bryobacteraceae bacterium]|nr:hypothetical protein [Bryobacteraceae bacterium]
MTDWLDKSLQSLAAEDPPAEALAEVRSRVLDQVRPKRRAWLWYLVPAAAAASLAIWFALPRPAVTPARQPVEVAVQAPATPAPEPPRTEPSAPSEPVRRPRPARPAPIQTARIETAKTFQPRILPTGSPDFVQIESGDPNVLILWSMNSPKITDQPGENK